MVKTKCAQISKRILDLLKLYPSLNLTTLAYVVTDDIL